MSEEDAPTPAEPDAGAAPGPSSAVAGIAAAVPILALLVGCGLTGVFFMGGPGAASEMGLQGVVPLVLFVMSGVVLAPLMFLAGRGMRVPAFVVLGLAASPWVVSLLAGWFSMMGAARDVGTADPASRATLVAMAVSQTLFSGVTGSVAGGTLLVASALGMGLAAVGQRAPRRALWAGALGFGVALPLAAVAAYGLLAREYFVVVSVLAALLVAVATALGLAGAGADDRGRSAAVASAVPWIGGLGVAALISAAVHKSTIVIFGAVANASADMRVVMMAHGGEELGPMLAARWLVPLVVVVAGLAAAGWATSRKRPGTTQLFGAAMLVLGFGGVLGFEALTRSLIARGAAAPATMAPERFDAASVNTSLGEPGEPDVFVGVTEMHAADGSGTSRSLREAFSQHRRSVAPAENWLEAEPEIVLSLDERAPSEVLGGLAAAAKEVGVRALALSVTRPLTEEQTDTLRSTVPVLWVAASAFQGSASLSVVVATEADLERASTDPLFLHTTLGDTAPTTMDARPGAPMDDRELDDAGGYDTFGDDPEPTPAWVVIGPQATAESLLTLVARLHASGRVPVLVERLPAAPPPTAPLGVLGGPLGALGSDDAGGLLAALRGANGAEGVGLGALGGTPRQGPRAPARPGPSSRVRADRPIVRGSLSAELVRRVVRRNLSQVRYCYESHLRRAPGAEGDVDLDFVIMQDGRVSQVQAQPSTIADVASCVARHARRWTFPSPSGGGVVAVRQAFHFEPG